MADIFISYARDDDSENEAVTLISEALQNFGYRVFWDKDIPVGQDFHEILEHELDSAKCVVVVWSEASRKSFWVREEATTGRDKGILVPITIDGETPPLGFRSIQTLSFESWDGSTENRRWFQFINAIDRFAPRRKQKGASRVTSNSPLHIVLVLDDSNSMAGANADAVNNEIAQLIDSLLTASMGQNPYFTVSVITYGSNATILYEAVSEKEIDPTLKFVEGVSGSVNIADALSATKHLLQRNPGKKNDFIPMVYLFAHDQPDNMDITIESANSLKRTNLPSGNPTLVAISIGPTDDSFMEKIASNQNLHVRLEGPAEILKLLPVIGTIGTYENGTGSNASDVEEAIMKL